MVLEPVECPVCGNFDDSRRGQFIAISNGAGFLHRQKRR
jgi:hypothetical protein